MNTLDDKYNTIQESVLLFCNVHWYQWKVRNSRHAGNKPLEICSSVHKQNNNK